MTELLVFYGIHGFVLCPKDMPNNSVTSQHCTHCYCKSQAQWVQLSSLPLKHLFGDKHQNLMRLINIRLAIVCIQWQNLESMWIFVDLNANINFCVQPVNVQGFSRWIAFSILNWKALAEWCHTKYKLWIDLKDSFKSVTLSYQRPWNF